LSNYQIEHSMLNVPLYLVDAYFTNKFWNLS
jgi:hypothetical protein